MRVGFIAGFLGVLVACGGGECEYEGQTYAAGESFPAADGCNTCSCNDDGSVACTEMGCIEDSGA